MNRRYPQHVVFPLLLLLAGLPAQADTTPPTGNSAAASPPPTPAPPAVITPPVSDGSAVPTPTDQTPPEVALPSPIPLGRGFLFSGALDARYRTATTGRTRQGWINDAEVDINHPLTDKGQSFGNVHVQVISENPPDILHAQDVQIGEAYVLYRLPFQTHTDSTAYLKVGQFQLPFGLLAVYDPHLLLAQPLYAQSLGLRTDFGFAVSGRFYGYLNYDFALTTGSGPNHFDSNPNRVVTFRLGRTFITRNGTVNVGGSLLQGHLPNTVINAADPLAFELPPSGYVRADRGFTAKTRIGGDGSYNYKALMVRGEAMIGADGDQRVEGYYAEGDYHLSPRISVVAARAVWYYPVINDLNSLSDRNSIGLTYAPGTDLTFRALFENLYDAPVDAAGQTRHRLTVQVLLRF